jgi:hypothetical protein
MPIAGGRGLENQRFELQSCPGGYIVIKRLSYGDKMLRKQKLGKTTVTSTNTKNNRMSDFVAEMQMINEEVTLFEFAKSIVSHNLEILKDPDDPTSAIPVDFANPDHVRKLDGSVGEEIDDIITRFNDWESDLETKKS